MPLLIVMIDGSHQSPVIGPNLFLPKEHYCVMGYANSLIFQVSYLGIMGWSCRYVPEFDDDDEILGKQIRGNITKDITKYNVTLVV